MPAGSDVYKGFGWEDGGVTCLARIIMPHSGAYITQATITSITCKVFDLGSATPDTAVATPTVTVASAVFDTLQTAAADLRIWTKDTTGFNFNFQVPASAFAAGNVGTKLERLFRIEFLFDPTTGENFSLVYEVTIRNLRGS